MAGTHVGIPVPTERFQKLCDTIRAGALKVDPVDAVQTAIDQWIAAQTGGGVPQNETERNPDGFWWKKVFIPTGSRVRMSYRSRRVDALTNSRGIEFEGATLSPSEFTWAVTKTNRNAWRDIEFAFPGSTAWVSADELRRKADSDVLN